MRWMAPERHRRAKMSSKVTSKGSKGAYRGALPSRSRRRLTRPRAAAAQS